MQNLNKITQATINLEKTTVLPINTNNTKQTQEITPSITFKEQFETTKILGIYFNEDLKNATYINWDNIIEKMEKLINILSPRRLSIYGKTILINTLILSKASHLSNVFAISAGKTNKINYKIFKYLWSNKPAEPIARKTIHLKQKSGGLNLIEPEAHNYAMRIKHLMTLNQKEKPPPWKNLATYWLTSDIPNYTKEFNFLVNNNRTKTINGKKPFYYKDITDYIETQNKKITQIKPETKTIYQNILQQHTKQYKIARETQWKNHIPNINFEKIWKSTSHMDKHSQKRYIIDYYTTRQKTKKYMHKCSRDINPQCHYCEHTEDNLHLFIQCVTIRNIWKHYQTILTKLTRQSYTPQPHILTLDTSNTNKNATKLRITIKIIICEIWPSCNNYKYENKLLPQRTIINKINGQLNNITITLQKTQSTRHTRNL